MQIKLEKPAPRCSVCGREFGDKEEFTAALIAGAEDDAFARSDICNDCWPAQDHAQYHCYWTSSFNQEQRSPLLDPDLLWQVLHRSLPSVFDRQEAAEFAHIAALALLRMKKLKLVDEKEEQGRNVMVFDGSKKRERYHVPDVSLTEARMTELQEQLREFADGDH